MIFDLLFLKSTGEGGRATGYMIHSRLNAEGSMRVVLRCKIRQQGACRNVKQHHPSHYGEIQLTVKQSCLRLWDVDDREGILRAHTWTLWFKG